MCIDTGVDREGYATCVLIQGWIGRGTPHVYGAGA